jgi:hypothetical protein
MRFPWFCLAAALGSLSCAHGAEVAPSASQFTPNLVNALDRPLRYRPDGADFVIENGAEFFNRSLYGGNTAFRVDGGDKPEFVLYLPGRGGNVRLGIRSGRDAKWLHDAAQIESRYRPGELLYRIRDPLLGPAGELTVEAVAAADTHALILTRLGLWRGQRPTRQTRRRHRDGGGPDQRMVSTPAAVLSWKFHYAPRRRLQREGKTRHDPPRRLAPRQVFHRQCPPLAQSASASRLARNRDSARADRLRLRHALRLRAALPRVPAIARFARK